VPLGGGGIPSYVVTTTYRKARKHWRRETLEAKAGTGPKPHDVLVKGNTHVKMTERVVYHAAVDW